MATTQQIDRSTHAAPQSMPPGQFAPHAPIELDHLSHDYGSRLALDGLTFDVRPAEIYQGRGDRKRTCRFARPHQTGVSQRNKTAPAAGRIKQGLSLNGTYKKILRDGEDVAGRQNIMEVCTHETIQ